MGASELTSTEPTPAATPEQPAAPPVVENPPAAAGVTDWQAEAEKWKGITLKAEARANANADAARKLKEIEDRDLSDLQKAQRDLAEATTRAEAAEKAHMRSQVALAKGIPADLVDTLSGGTLDELNSHADRLLAWRGSVAPPVPPQPKPDPSQGAQPLSGQAAEDAEYAKYRAELFPSYHQK